MGWALVAELILLAGFTAGWEISGARPAGWVQFCVLATAAAAMGVQSSTVRSMGLSEVSTTYLTGTLTGLVSSLVSPGQDTPHGLRRFGVLIGLAAGASLSGLLVAVGGGRRSGPAASRARHRARAGGRAEALAAVQLGDLGVISAPSGTRSWAVSAGEREMSHAGVSMSP